MSVGTVKNLSSQYIYTHALQVVDAHPGADIGTFQKIKYQEREKEYRMNHIGTREIATERLTLRRFEIEDAENVFYNWFSDEQTVKYLTWPVYKSVDEAEDMIKSWIAQYDNTEYYNWAIELNDLEQPIGNISVVSIDEKTESIELGYCLGSQFFNKGYMTEAVTAIIRFFINEVGAGRVWARHDTENPNSGKVMAAAGMDYEGTLRHAGFNNQGICEAEAAKKDMADMLDYIDKLEELDTSGIEPMSHVFPVNNVFRDDVVTNGDGSEATLANAPVKKDGGFKVPKTIGE